jgi:uncharacterized protein YecE (DUF72 family)
VKRLTDIADGVRRFYAPLEPMIEAGRLGPVLWQLPETFHKDLERLSGCLEQLPTGMHAFEFRHRSWYEEGQREETLRFLEEHRMSHVVVDAPRSEGKNVPLTVLALTSPVVYVRMHGRNAGTWNVRGGSAAERFDYLYSDKELAEWVPQLKELSQQAEQAFVVFNNNNRSRVGGRETAQAPANAEMLRDRLAEANVPVSRPESRARAGSR